MRGLASSQFRNSSKAKDVYVYMHTLLYVYIHTHVCMQFVRLYIYRISIKILKMDKQYGIEVFI